MSKFSMQWVESQNARRAPKVEIINDPFAGLESRIHTKIIDYCRSKKWYYVHSRMDRRATNAVGTPDFIIAADHGRCLWIECKRKGAKLTEEQRNAQYWLKTLGHEAYAVWSFEDFLAVVEGKR